MTTTHEAVILANGEFPRKGSAARQLLTQARRVVACDGAARNFCRHFKRKVDHVVGDMDSLGKQAAKFARHPPMVIAEQVTNDLDKAIRFCRAQGWKRLAIVGASGKREDHTLGNVFRAMEAGVEVWTDCGRFVPFGRKRDGEFGITFKVAEGTPISVFATNRKIRMRSKGLAWALDDVRFDNLYCATLNRSSAKQVSILATDFAFIFVAN